jgi:uncharacterized protein (DUF433 family)
VKIRGSQNGARHHRITLVELRTYIVIDSEIRFGKPCIKGTRITVGDILQWLSNGMTEQEILEDYPELQQIHIKAALAFATERDAMTRVLVHETVVDVGLKSVICPGV